MKIQLINPTVRDLVAGYRDGEGGEMTGDSYPTPSPSPTGWRGEFRKLFRDMLTITALVLPPPIPMGGPRGVNVHRS